MMFAGESSSLGWHTKATGVPTRRLAERQVISFLISPDLPYDRINNLQNDNTRYRYGNDNAASPKTPCTFVNGELNGLVTGCQIMRKNDNSERRKTWNTETNKKVDNDVAGYNTSQSVIVPEQYIGRSSIGAKYCTTLG